MGLPFIFGGLVGDGYMPTLNAETHLRRDLTNGLTRSLFTLYDKYYDGTDYSLFLQDLSNKDYVILLRDNNGAIQGFSTLAVLPFEFEANTQRAIFSGDTIINHYHWGERTLPIAWCHLAGQIKASAPEQPLYWFLIVKGYRTYRYLSLFSKRFFPTWRHDTPPQYQALMNYLATMKFGSAYDPQRGVIRFPTPHGYLRKPWADIRPAIRDKPDVRYFLERNPGYEKGDELMCLTELCPENLRSHARQAFMEGLRK